jgi:hypothetical protein
MSIKLVLLINFLAVRPGDPKDEKPNDAYKWKSLPLSINLYIFFNFLLQYLLITHYYSYPKPLPILKGTLEKNSIQTYIYIDTLYYCNW